MNYFSGVGSGGSMTFLPVFWFSSVFRAPDKKE